MTTVDCTSALHAGQRYVRQRTFAAIVFSGCPFSWPAASASSPLACNSVCRSRASCCCCSCWCSCWWWCCCCCCCCCWCCCYCCCCCCCCCYCSLAFTCVAMASHVSRRVCCRCSFLRRGCTRCAVVCAARLRTVACTAAARHASHICLPLWPPAGRILLYWENCCTGNFWWQYPQFHFPFF